MLKRAQALLTGVLIGGVAGWVVVQALIPYLPAIVVLLALVWILRVIVHGPR